MPSIERDGSLESERRLRHQHSSSSDGGRALVPMWDSSDPERAPPPLPMNPSSPGVASRPNTSSAIQSVHAALTEKARESAYVTNSIAKRIEGSPERSLIKGAAHKRMQSLHNGSVRDLSSFIDGGNLMSSPKSPEKPATKPCTPHANRDFQLERSPEREISRSATPTPSRDLSLQNTPTIRPSVRRPPQSILGENAPPQSATMLALQHMASKDLDAPLSNITNGSTALVRAPQTFDAISNQILSLTSIATSLQKEMSQLSRRSKDNATDLVSLKEATNARDEDIRRSLRELVNNLSESESRSSSNLYSGGPLYLDSKAHNSPGSRNNKPFILPRIPSPNSFAASLDRESLTTPSFYSSDGGAAVIALLEKVLREMGTKEGQDMLVARLTDISQRLSSDQTSIANKLEDLVQMAQKNNSSQALVPANGDHGARTRNQSFDEPSKLQFESGPSRSGPMTARVEALLGTSANKENFRNAAPSPAAGVVTEDVLKIIRTVKDSVAQSGGLTAEVKALVRELRGEVLGMGREIGRKLEQAKTQKDQSTESAEGKDQTARIVQDGLEELRQHMDRVLRESRRQSSSSSASRNTVDYQEIYNAMRAAIKENTACKKTELGKQDIVDAVKEAWENYKPDIELQHFGLEREELLSCLKAGIQEYAPQESARDVGGATREEVFEAVVEGLKHFSPPRIETETSLSREEILDAVRECLEEFEFPSAPPAASLEHDITRDDMVNAVKEGLSTFNFPSSGSTKEVSRADSGLYSADDIFEAVKSGIADAPLALDRVGEEVIERLQEILELVRTEFKAVSDEAKQNVAAHGRDTEQVLDATKDGFEKLRGDIESYVDKISDIEGKDDILDSMQESFASLRAEMERLLSESSSQSLKSFKGELDTLQETLACSVVPGSGNADKEEILRAFKEGMDGLRADIDKPRGSNESILSGTGEILDALHDGLTGLRAEVDKIGNKPVDMTVNYEILDTLKVGLEELRADMDRIRADGHGDRAVAEITAGSIIPAEALKRNDIEHLEVLITQLRIKVEALESMPPPPPQPFPGSASKEDLAAIENLLRNVQESVGIMTDRSSSGADDSATREDMEAIETLLRNTKAKIDDMHNENIVKDNFDSLETLVTETRLNLTELTTHLEDVSKSEEVSTIDTLVRGVLLGLEEMKERAQKDAEDVERVTKTDVEAVEAVCLDVKSAIEQMLLTDIAALASKDDVKLLGEIVKEFRGRIELHAETNATAFEERQAETVGVGERVLEIKAFMEEFKDTMKAKMEEGFTGVEVLGKLLEKMGETIEGNATISEDIKVLFETMKAEFEKSNAGVVGSKLEADEKFQLTWDKLDAKMDEKFNELMAKYDEAQISAEIKSKIGEEKLAETEIAMLATKAVAEELKLAIDTLGTTVTDSTEKMEEASKTVFGRVDDTFVRVEETQAAAKAEHQTTREHISKTLVAVEGVHSHVSDYHPKILDSIKDVLLIVGQHYEHSKSGIATIQERIAERPAPIPRDETPLLPPATEKYDDAQVHEKLDKLVDHMHVAGKSFAQLEMLDRIHQQVMETAAEVSEFVSIQTQRITADHEDKEKALETATIELEKRLAQKDHIEATMVKLREEKEHMYESVAILRAEQEDLAHQKMRLSADVSSLETALRLRREELHAMEARAEGLERRILEGVIDHSRALLLSNSSKGRDVMSRKRVPSHATSTTGSIASTATTTASRTTQSAVSMTLGSNRRAMATLPLGSLAGPSKRIFSLNQISQNVPTGGASFSRSHSVKALGGSNAIRKSSWGGSLNQRYGDLNKENLALKESEEDEVLSDEDVERDHRTGLSSRRRSSAGTTVLTSTITGTSESVSESYDDGTEYSESADEETPREEVSEVVLFREASEAA